MGKSIFHCNHHGKAGCDIGKCVVNNSQMPHVPCNPRETPVMGRLENIQKNNFVLQFFPVLLLQNIPQCFCVNKPLKKN